MKITVNLDSTMKGLGDLIKKVERPVSKAVTTGAMQLVRESTRRIGAESQGRRYRRGRTTRVASRHPFPPNYQTGFLKRSITMTKKGTWVVYVIAGARYASWLENGTKDGKIKPRPFMKPSRDRTEPAIRKRIIDAYNEALK